MPGNKDKLLPKDFDGDNKVSIADFVEEIVITCTPIIKRENKLPEWLTEKISTEVMLILGKFLENSWNLAMADKYCSWNAELEKNQWTTIEKVQFLVTKRISWLMNSLKVFILGDSQVWLVPITPATANRNVFTRRKELIHLLMDSSEKIFIYDLLDQIKDKKWTYLFPENKSVFMKLYWNPFITKSNIIDDMCVKLAEELVIKFYSFMTDELTFELNQDNADARNMFREFLEYFNNKEFWLFDGSHASDDHHTDDETNSASDLDSDSATNETYNPFKAGKIIKVDFSTWQKTP